ncbi:MAG: hypothetical protein A2Y58_04125 [Chloroflexi bacterium RBG_13_51_52]|nr:MAG: hypothetical protein A2Y58_04125 [Chloroflexi bacterium RBG_13_51_52]
MRLLVAMAITLIMIVVLLLNGCAGSQIGDGNTLELIAPDFQLQSTDGGEVALSDLRGKPVMLNFWATYCGPCRTEMPLFQEIYEDPGWLQEGLVILVVNSQENADDVRQFVEENGFSFTVLLDITGEVGYKYNVRGLPATFFIDKDGIIRNVTIGGFWDKAQIEQRLNLITK